MSVAHRAARRGAIAASGASPKKTINYTFTAKPAGTLDVALDANAGASAINSNALREGANSGTAGQYYLSAAVMPDVMSTLYSTTVTNAAQSTSQRGMGPGCFSSDGTKGVFAILKGNTGAAAIYSWTGGVYVSQATLGGLYSTSSSDQIAIVPSVAAGVVTWTVVKNGTPTSLSWPDSGHVVDLPGTHPAACFLHQYSGGQFYSPGISALAAADL